MKQHFMTYFQFFLIRYYLLTRYRESGRLDQPVQKVTDAIQEYFGYTVTKNNLRTAMRAIGIETCTSKRSREVAQSEIELLKLVWDSEQDAIIEMEVYGKKQFEKRFYPKVKIPFCQ